MTTPESRAQTVTDVVLDHTLEAARAADAAASAAGVIVRELTDLHELEEVLELYARIWGGRAGNPPLPLELLRAFSKAGNYVGGAYLPDGRLVGACVGFFHAPADDALHSHIAGVDASMVDRHVGFALKLHQRSWTLGRGVSDIAWTFDPLVGRNAYFNLVKLGATPVEYLPNFYGPTADSLNGVDESDRLLVRWHLLDPAVDAGASRSPLLGADEPGPVVALAVGPDGQPVRGRLDAAVSSVAVPPDIRTLRSSNPDLAHRWRLAVRDVLSELLADGARITGFDRGGWYIVGREL